MKNVLVKELLINNKLTKEKVKLLGEKNPRKNDFVIISKKENV
jgi:hypothetical protein